MADFFKIIARALSLFGLRISFYFLLLLVLLRLPVLFTPFSTIILVPYSMKTLGNLQFSEVFRGFRSGTLTESLLNVVTWLLSFLKLALPSLLIDCDFFFRAFVLVQRFAVYFKFSCFTFFCFSLCLILSGFHSFRKRISFVAYVFFYFSSVLPLIVYPLLSQNTI